MKLSIFILTNQTTFVFRENRGNQKMDFGLTSLDFLEYSIYSGRWYPFYYEKNFSI